jgi:two-component system, OmpR family, alkaline phosphatase synthesis response regulator PhoP
VEQILVIDDDLAVQRILRQTLEDAGFQTAVAGDGTKALQMFRTTAPGAVILELRLPGNKSGYDLCREIRASSKVPIVVLSATKDECDKILLLELGADDYVTKPFSPRELLARVRAALRRSHENAIKDQGYQFGDIEVNFQKMELLRNGKNVPFSRLEFKLLRFFLDNQQRVVSQDELLKQVWGYRGHAGFTSGMVRTQILGLRKKIEKDPSNPVHFRTVHGSGYKFVP